MKSIAPSIWVLPWALMVLLAGCAAPAEPLTLECFDSQLLCYRGHSIDRRATRDHYGVEGQQAINRNEFSF
ncbi:MAG: hypothetical protein KDK04_02155 [Candidatus Competibacteraceae bacterium]|nr:hypothetical protein [Candidatus Competibacteraceae bacterium]MCB1810515.1 hypothetical protein [Candidatus Competibacteraceae bacterium]